MQTNFFGKSFIFLQELRWHGVLFTEYHTQNMNFIKKKKIRIIPYIIISQIIITHMDRKRMSLRFISASTIRVSWSENSQKRQFSEDRRVTDLY